jgi:diguanylate cyclase (GGDEF)-like protein
MAERLWEVIQNHPLPVESGADRITVSVGVAHIQPDDAGESLLSRADAAMYAGKRKGGNMVHVAVDGEFRQLAGPPRLSIVPAIDVS